VLGLNLDTYAHLRTSESLDVIRCPFRI